MGPVRALLCCLLISLHKKTVAIRALFYNSEIDRSIVSVYNIIHICMRRESIPHNANYVVVEKWRNMIAVSPEYGIENFQIK